MQIDVCDVVDLEQGEGRGSRPMGVRVEEGMGWNGASNGADCIQQQGSEVDKGMRGDVMEMQSSCMEPTGLSVCPANGACYISVWLLCEQGAASRSMSKRCYRPPSSPPVIPLRRNNAPIVQVIFELELGQIVACWEISSVRSQDE